MAELLYTYIFLKESIAILAGAICHVFTLGLSQIVYALDITGTSTFSEQIFHHSETNEDCEYLHGAGPL